MSEEPQSHGRGHGRGRGGRGGRGHNSQQRSYNSERSAPKDSKEAVPILRYGPSNNWIDFTKKVSLAACEHYGDLGKLIDDEKYYEPAEIDQKDYGPIDEKSDPYGIRKTSLLEAVKSRIKKIDRMKDDRPSLYAFIMSKLSRESEDELKRTTNYYVWSVERDPLQLWLSLKSLHLITTLSKNSAIVRAQAIEDYHNCRMQDFEKLSVFKERFENKLQAYNTAMGITDAKGNSVKENEEISAMNFLSKLCKLRLGNYYAFKMNQINSDPSKVPKTINSIYLEASTYISPVPTRDTTRGGVSFSTADGMISSLKKGKRGPKGGNDTDSKPTGPKVGNDKNESSPKTDADAKLPTNTPTTPTGGEKPSGRDMSKVECYNCNEFGHFAYQCPKKKSGLNAMTRKNHEEIEWYHVGLDSCSQVNVMNPRFLSNIRPGEGSYVGLRGESAETNLIGDLKGFFPVQVCDTCAASILSLSDVEELYEVTYIPGVKFIVHMNDKDLVFYKRGKIYLADMSDWVTYAGLSMMTVEQRESMYSKRQVQAAKKAGEFIENIGYPSQAEAIKMIRDGNVSNIPVEVADVKLFFEIYGEPIPSIRGKTTNDKRVNQRDNYDPGLQQQVSTQQLTADVMTVAGVKFILSVAEPLNLIINSYVKTLGQVTLGRAVQGHLDVLSMFGFNARIMRVDPLKALASLRGRFTGVEIDISGAGDHLPMVDIRIRRVKELARATIQSLDFTMSKSLIKYLMTYCVSRINIRAGAGSSGGNTCPRVKLTGRRVNYKKEFALKFGDYVEVKDPKVISNSMSPRTSPAIALYPTASINGSWKFLNLETKKIVSRNIFKKTPAAPNYAIAVMNSMADGCSVSPDDITGVDEADTGEDEVDAGVIDFEEEEEEEPEVKTHTPDPNVIEALGAMQEHEPEADLEGDEIEEVNAPSISNENLRRSERSTAGQTSKFQDFIRPDGISGFTSKWGLALAHLSVKVAMESFGTKAYEAIKEELLQLIVRKKALRALKWSEIKMLFDEAKKASILFSHMFLKEKFDAAGLFEKLKARLVGDGRTQIRDEDYSSPTARIESIFNSLKITVEEDRAILVLDIGGAYLNAKIDAEVFMWLGREVSSILIQIIPEYKDYTDERGRILVQVEKALYGLIQSAKLWYEHLTGVLRKNGFESNSIDPCVMNKTVNGIQITVVIYVDDLMITSKSQDEIYKVRDLIEKEFIEIKVKEGKEFTYLGMLLKREEDGSIEINMQSYVESTINEWMNIEDYYEYAIPADPKLNYNDPESPPSKKKELFHRLVAKLLYLSKRGRPDIALSVNYLCTRVKAPTVQDEAKLTRILGYLKSTMHKTRVITKDGKLEKVTAYIDAAFAAHEDGKGQSGGAIFIGSTLVDVITRKQKCASRDSTESELIALSDLVTDVEWHNEWFENQGYNFETPLIYQDNTSTITLVTNESSGKMRNKHLRAQRAAVYEGYERKYYTFEYIRTDDMVADVLTKPLEGMKFHKFSKALLGTITMIKMRTETAGVRCVNRACKLGRACKCKK